MAVRRYQAQKRRLEESSMTGH